MAILSKIEPEHVEKNMKECVVYENGCKESPELPVEKFATKLKLF